VIGIQGIVSSFVYASNMQLCRCSKQDQSDDHDQPSKEMELVEMTSRK
jgi:hypothetical protein